MIYLKEKIITSEQLIRDQLVSRQNFVCIIIESLYRLKNMVEANPKIKD
jgi:hypothetical protein